MLVKIKKEFRNIKGWSTSRKIVVFESDDWGSTRFKDKTTRDLFIKKGYPIEKCWMSMIDSLESNKDVSTLLDLISEFKDFKNNQPKFTLLFNPANPDFDKIKNVDFQSYFFESVDKTYEKYDDSDTVISQYKKALQNKLITIEYHGREHLNVNRWMKSLQKKEKDALVGFEYQFWGFSKSYAPDIINSYRSAFDVDEKTYIQNQKEVLHTGIQLINNLFNLQPLYFVAPDGPFSLNLIDTLEKAGIKYIGLPKIHKEPLGNFKTKSHYFWMGKTFSNNLIALTRNSSFEPNSPNQSDWIASCLNDIKCAFRWRKPAVVSMHRANFIGRIDPSKRDKSIRELKLLIKAIIEKWPNVEFLSSKELGDLIAKKGDDTKS